MTTGADTSNERKGLKPCPFCGSDQIQCSSGIHVYDCHCLVCGAIGPDKNGAGAIERWNTRALSTPSLESAQTGTVKDSLTVRELEAWFDNEAHVAGTLADLEQVVTFDQLRKLFARQPAQPSTYYWWCPECKEEVDGRRVTFQELHDSCGTRVIEKVTQPSEHGVEVPHELCVAWDTQAINAAPVPGKDWRDVFAGLAIAWDRQRRAGQKPAALSESEILNLAYAAGFSIDYDEDEEDGPLHWISDDGDHSEDVLFKLVRAVEKRLGADPPVQRAEQEGGK